MAKKPGGDDGYGHDPERAAVRDMFEGMERRQAERPARPARQIGEVLKLPRITTTQKRLLNANAAILDGAADERAYLHTVLCQTGLPYRPTDLRRWRRDQGAASLLIEAGVARHPETGEWIDLPLPHGERPRLILIYLSTEAVRTESSVIDVGDSMTAFARSLGIDTNGPSLRHFKDQLSRISTATVRLGIARDGRTVQINTQIVHGIDLWFPKDAGQRVLWPSTVQLSADYFASLQQHAVPLDPRAVAVLAHSAMALDVYTWLAQRLHRVPRGQPQAVTWLALKAQFGPDYDRLRKFREKFKVALRTVMTVYPGARIEEADEGLLLWTSKPPITKRMVAVSRPEPPTIDGVAVEVPESGGKPVDG
jgi:Plasmid encoded RepA protein